MADFTLLNLTAKNDTMTRNQVLQQSLPMGEDDTLYFFQEESCIETPYYNQGGFNHNHTATVPMVQDEVYMENPYYNNHTAMVPMTQEFYMETLYYNNHMAAVPMAQEFYMEPPNYNHVAMVPMAQEFYMENPCYNHAAMVPMTQEFYMETAYYNYNYNNKNNHAVMVPMAQEFYMETPYYNPAAMVPMAQKFYKKTSNYSTTVVPLTQEWMFRLQTNMDDGYGSTWIMEKFLTSLSECERETPPTYQDASVQEFASQCNSGVGNNQKSWTSQPRNRFGETVSEDANNRTASEVTQPQSAPPSDTGKNCSNVSVNASVCLSPSNKFAGDGNELKRLEEAELLHSPDIEGWMFWSRSEAGSIYYSEDEMSEEMTGHSIGPDVDRMEERLVFPTPSVPDRLVNSEDWVFWSRSEAGSIYYSEDKMSEKMTGHSCIGPDVDRMEERLVFPTPSVPDRLVNSEGWVFWSRSEAGSIYYSEDEMSEVMTGHSIGPDVDRMEERLVFPIFSVPDRLLVVNKLSDYPSEEIQLLDHIEVDHQSDGTEDLEEIQLLDFIEQLQLDHSSDGTEENFQLLDPFEVN
ncbi:PREDICTED: uncharacterized protein LOC109487585 [Branchiostoma belcheri]|uniref:Uncharacterized protein LOC109487585 n=1 Tax=Branchiostoma belcheri TaxID=7741 RepID=A0A6P5A1I3_BRABE|nr:PREDICTED: uncharacterized protein LOC109487585 [Branchiostoma belcheri]